VNLSGQPESTTFADPESTTFADKVSYARVDLRGQQIEN